MTDEEIEEKASRLVDVEFYKSARMACEIAKSLLEQHDFSTLIAAIDRADSIGPVLDPTLWREKHRAMLEDREVFAAALRFLGPWKKSDPRKRWRDPQGRLYLEHERSASGERVDLRTPDGHVREVDFVRSFHDRGWRENAV